MKTDGPKVPPAEAQEKKPLIEYPAVYTFKVMGVQEHGFVEYVRTLFKRLMGTEISPDSISEQPSSKGKYVSVSISVYLLSEEHRRAIYAQLHQEKRIVYYL
jgi:putative lipoic acid-binding regulatory protein